MTGLVGFLTVSEDAAPRRVDRVFVGAMLLALGYYAVRFG